MTAKRSFADLSGAGYQYHLPLQVSRGGIVEVAFHDDYFTHNWIKVATFVQLCVVWSV
jgi:hypothetical protein